jgi:hypothetical protein
MSGLPRIPEAKTYETDDIPESELVPRVFWFFVQYNWQTRLKQFFLNEPSPELTKAFEDKSRWNQIYRCECEFPVPTYADERKEITAHVAYNEIDIAPDDEDPSFSVATRMFRGVCRILPSNWFGAGKGYSAVWLSKLKPTERGAHSFVIITQENGKRLRVTVEEIE